MICRAAIGMPEDLISSKSEPPRRRQTSRATPSVLLPSDLKASLAILNDRDFELLLAEVMKEAARRRDLEAPDAPRNTTSPAKRSRNERKPPLTESIPLAKANLVRAAFKAGVKAPAIARQFGISQALVEKLLRSR